MGITWNIREKRWATGYEYAKRFYEENGHLNVPQCYVTEDGYKLGIWIETQKVSNKNGKLAQSKINMLEEIGIKWSTKKSV